MADAVAPTFRHARQRFGSALQSRKLWYSVFLRANDRPRKALSLRGREAHICRQMLMLVVTRTPMYFSRASTRVPSGYATKTWVERVVPFSKMCRTPSVFRPVYPRTSGGLATGQIWCPAGSSQSLQKASLLYSCNTPRHLVLTSKAVTIAINEAIS